MILKVHQSAVVSIKCIMGIIIMELINLDQKIIPDIYQLQIEILENGKRTITKEPL